MQSSDDGTVEATAGAVTTTTFTLDELHDELMSDSDDVFKAAFKTRCTVEVINKLLRVLASRPTERQTEQGLDCLHALWTNSGPKRRERLAANITSSTDVLKAFVLNAARALEVDGCFEYVHAIANAVVAHHDGEAVNLLTQLCLPIDEKPAFEFIHASAAVVGAPFVDAMLPHVVVDGLHYKYRCVLVGALVGGIEKRSDDTSAIKKTIGEVMTTRCGTGDIFANALGKVKLPAKLLSSIARAVECAIDVASTRTGLAHTTFTAPFGEEVHVRSMLERAFHAHAPSTSEAASTASPAVAESLVGVLGWAMRLRTLSERVGVCVANSEHAVDLVRVVEEREATERYSAGNGMRCFCEALDKAVPNNVTVAFFKRYNERQAADRKAWVEVSTNQPNAVAHQLVNAARIKYVTLGSGLDCLLEEKRAPNRRDCCPTAEALFEAVLALRLRGSLESMLDAIAQRIDRHAELVIANRERYHETRDEQHPLDKMYDYHRRLRIDRLHKSANAVRGLHDERGVLMTQFRAMVNASAVASSAPARWIEAAAATAPALVAPASTALAAIAPAPIAPAMAPAIAARAPAAPAPAAPALAAPAPAASAAAAPAQQPTVNANGLAPMAAALRVLQRRVRPRAASDCARCVVARTDPEARSSFTNPQSGGSGRGRNIDGLAACPLFAHGVQLNTLLGLLRGVTGLSSKERKEAVVNFMRDEHNVQPLGTQPQYRVALYTPSADGSLQPVDKNGVPFPPSTKETRGHYTFFQGMQVVQEDAES